MSKPTIKVHHHIIKPTRTINAHRDVESISESTKTLRFVFENGSDNDEESPDTIVENMLALKGVNDGDDTEPTQPSKKRKKKKK